VIIYKIVGTTDFDGSQPPEFCPDGTYSDAQGLQSDEQCRPCTSGNYCEDGVIAGDCVSGFWCYAGAGPDYQTETDDDGNLKFHCPSGHYCEADALTGSGVTLPTGCPEETFRLATGGECATSTDGCSEYCTACEAGYYCVSGYSTPFICPKGHYCPVASSTATACPEVISNQLLV
jgi:hypothetical protein